MVVRPQADDFPTNRIRNTKYTTWSFFPLILSEQFRVPMNAYFLLIALLQLWRAITPVNPITTWAPLAFVLAITCVREALDDRKRMAADAAANARTFDVYRCGALRPTTRSEDIRVGDLVVVPADHEVPCDLVLMKTSAVGDDGSAAIETANLDGETDLKTRCARQETQLLSTTALAATDAYVECEPPNADVYRFDATLVFQPGSEPSTHAPNAAGAARRAAVPLSPEQLVQQGTVLRKTRWIVGLAVCKWRSLLVAPPGKR